MTNTTPPTPSPQPSAEDQLAELRAALASLHDQTLDRRDKTKEILAHLVEASDLAQRGVDNLRAQLDNQQRSIDSLQAQLAGLSKEMLANDGYLADAVALLLAEDADGHSGNASPASEPTSRRRSGFFRWLGATFTR